MSDVTADAAAIVAMERAALDRWGRGDPSGFLEISASDVVYFDPFLDTRLDGLEALAAYYERLRGQIAIQHDEMQNVKVQFAGDAAVLTFNFTAHVSDGTFRWNCTEVYRRTGDRWEIIQTHWAFTLGAPPAATGTPGGAA